MSRAATIILLCLLGAFAVARAEPGPVALMADLAGEIHLRSEAAGDGRNVALMQRLPADVSLLLAADARATVFYPASGAAFELRGRGQFLVGVDEVRAAGDAASPVRRQLNAAFRNIQLQRVHITQAGVVMRGAGNQGRPQPLGPEGLVMSGSGLVFKWSPAEGGGSYRFRLTDTAGEPIYEATTTATELALPSKVTPPAGRRLMWSVQAAGRLSPNRWANLIVADAATREAAAALDQAGDMDSAIDRNLRALLLTQQVLREE
jgi:hypothetical protein